MPFEDLMSGHARRGARRRGIPMDLIEEAYVDPDHVRPSSTDPDIREVRSRVTEAGIVDVVVDVLDGRVVTVYLRSRWARR